MDTTTPAPSAPPPVAAPEDKTVAILSYLTLLGFIVAIVMHSSKKTKLGAFHLRQAMGLFITLLCLGFIPFVNCVAIIAIFILVIMGFISALNGQMKPVPLVGPLYQKWFGSAFE